MFMEALAVLEAEDAFQHEAILARVLAASEQDVFRVPPEPVATGLDVMALSLLPVDEWTGPANADTEETECQMCLGDYEVKDKVMRLPCLHVYHAQCLEQWLMKSGKCPSCKMDIAEAMGLT